MLVWLDLETTGLKASECSVLEVAVIITDDDFHEVARMERVVYFPLAASIVELLDAGYDHASIEKHFTGHRRISAKVLEMHDKNGLWRACVTGVALDTVDREVEAFVKQHAVRVESKIVEVPDGNGPGFETKTETILPQIAGSTISFDRAFIDAHLPRLAKQLHYRNVDVSTLNEICKRVLPEVYEARPRVESAAHRGMADIELSIAGLKHYVRTFQRAVGAWVAGVAPIGDLVRP